MKDDMRGDGSFENTTMSCYGSISSDCEFIARLGDFQFQHFWDWVVDANNSLSDTGRLSSAGTAQGISEKGARVITRTASTT